MDGRRIVFSAPREVRLEPFAVPSPAPGQVLVRTTRTLVSAGTELKSYLGLEHRGNRPYPRTTGYSHTGVVVQVGDAVTDVREGDRVATIKGHASHVIVDLSRPESFGEWLRVIPDGVTDEQATFAVLGSVAMHGVRKAAFRLDESCILAGQGVVGQLAGQLARLNGARPVIGMDLSEERLEKSRQSGIDAQVLVGDTPHAAEQAEHEALAHTHGRGADVCIDCTATTHAFPGLLRLAAMQGRIVILGSLVGMVEISLFDEIQLKELTIVGVHQPKAPVAYHPINPWTQSANRRSVLELIQSGRLRVDHLISHVSPADDAPALYELMASGPRGWLATVFRWDA